MNAISISLSKSLRSASREAWKKATFLFLASSGPGLSGCCQPEGVGVYEATLVPVIQGCSQGQPLVVEEQAVEVEIYDFDEQQCSQQLRLNSPILVRDAAEPTTPVGLSEMIGWLKENDSGEQVAEGAPANVDYVGSSHDYEGAVRGGVVYLALGNGHGSFEGNYEAQERGDVFLLRLTLDLGGPRCEVGYEARLRRR